MLARLFGRLTSKFSHDYMQADQSKSQKREKFDFEKMKAAATSEDAAIRKAEFIEYFERFNEFPSFLFDNAQNLDPRLAATMQDLSIDENSSKALLEGVKALHYRLPF